MPSDLKADLRRLVELRQDIRDLIGEGHTEALADFRSACIRFDFAAAAALLEQLEKKLDHKDLCHGIALQRVAELEAENQRLREENAFLMDSLQQR